MYVLRISYRSKTYHRRSTCGGMDSEPAGSSVDDKIYRIVIADNSDRDMNNAVHWFERENSHLENFKIIDAIIENQVHAILRKPITNLNIQ